ncbi:LysR family transcriptional regulator [Aeromicrobium massiliense]|uniref:LysR family transcriptional regulator n=1 Tax=Aeromicrobium massiliense TaxID=1464554 RepID=UPI000578A6F9|nr:LysR family transcriptional regulator [Aeromicrobium massiliense]
MELRTLRYFVAVADAGTVSAAADAVRVTQPALSRQLRQLERELGLDLFDRAAGRLTLSSSGRALLPLARDVLGRADDLRRAAALRTQGRLETVTIAAPATTLTDLVSPFIATLERTDPVPAVLTSDDLPAAEALARGADLVITPYPPDEPLAATSLAVLPVLAYVRADHPWAGRREVDLAELHEVGDLIGLPQPFGARRALDEAVSAAGLPPLRLTEASNGTVAQALAAGGRGVALVTDDPRFDLVPLPLTSEGRTVSIELHGAWSPEHPGAALLADLAARLRAWVARRYA